MTGNAANAPQMDASLMLTVEALRRIAICRDDQAWTAILNNHGRRILRLAERMVGKALADDVCQETLLQIRAHAGKFSLPPGVADAEGAARGWVMCIAYRTALGMLRVNQRRSHREQEAGLQRERQATGPDEAALSAEQSELVRREVSELPEVLRGAVCLHYYGELSYADVSSALACSEDVARKRVERGVTELRGRLASAGVAVGAVALTSALAGSSSAASGSVSAAVGFKQLCAWQALLHSSHAPALAGIVKWGGLAIMSKYIVGAAAVLALALSGIQTWRISSLSRELSDLREKSDTVALQEKVGTLEKQLGETRGEAAALKANLSIRSDEVAQIDRRLKGFEQYYGGVPKMNLNMDVTAATQQKLHAYRDAVAKANEAAEQAALVRKQMDDLAMAEEQRRLAAEVQRQAEVKAETDLTRTKEMDNLVRLKYATLAAQQQALRDEAKAALDRTKNEEAQVLRGKLAADAKIDAARAEQAKLIEAENAALQAKVEHERLLQAELERQQVNVKRQQEDVARKQAEEIRLKTELDRQQVESKRLQADGARLQAEATRLQADADRLRAEELRAQEIDRRNLARLKAVQEQGKAADEKPGPQKSVKPPQPPKNEDAF